MNEALRKAADDIDLSDRKLAVWLGVAAEWHTSMPVNPRLFGALVAEVQAKRQALRDQESEIATHRDNHTALVIRLGEVTTRLEAADGLLRECAHFIDYGGAADDELAEKITTQLKAADHV